MKYELTPIPAKFVRASQSGDWTLTMDGIVACVADGHYSTDSELAILIHELIEAYLCRKSGVSESLIVEFDEQYEKDRKEGAYPQDSEPGDHPDCPYRLEHQAATHVERAVCAAIGLNWTEHEQAVGELEVEPETLTQTASPPRPDPGPVVESPDSLKSNNP